MNINNSSCSWNLGYRASWQRVAFYIYMVIGFLFAAASFLPAILFNQGFNPQVLYDEYGEYLKFGFYGYMAFGFLVFTVGMSKSTKLAKLSVDQTGKVILNKGSQEQIFNINQQKPRFYKYYIAALGTIGAVLELKSGSDKITIGAKGVEANDYVRGEIAKIAKADYFLEDKQFKQLIAELAKSRKDLISQQNSNLKTIRIEQKASAKILILLGLLILTTLSLGGYFWVQNQDSINHDLLLFGLPGFAIIAVLLLIFKAFFSRSKDYEIQLQGQKLILSQGIKLVDRAFVQDVKYKLYNQRTRYGNAGVSLKLIFPKKKLHPACVDVALSWKRNYSNKTYLPGDNIQKQSLIKLTEVLGIRDNLQVAN
jgi:hypothetical protein